MFKTLKSSLSACSSKCSKLKSILVSCSAISSSLKFVKLKFLKLLLFLLLISVICSLYFLNNMHTHRKIRVATLTQAVKEHGVSARDVRPPAVIVSMAKKRNSGLANLMFRYACAFALSQDLGIPLYVEILPEALNVTAMHPSFRDTNERTFALHLFNIPQGDFVVKESYSHSDSLEIPQEEFLTRRAELRKMKDKILIVKDGCQSWMYFRNHEQEIRRRFQLDLRRFEPQFLETIKDWLIKTQRGNGNASVGVHIRRGDYPGSFATPIEWFPGAMHLMQKKLIRKSKSVGVGLGVNVKVTFFMFSDNIGAVKEELTKNNASALKGLDVVWVSSSSLSSLQEFYLMTKCQHMIISGLSTFGWWAAWLTDDKDEEEGKIPKIVIASKINPSFYKRIGNGVQHFAYEKLWQWPGWIVLDRLAFSGNKTT